MSVQSPRVDRFIAAIERGEHAYAINMSGGRSSALMLWLQLEKFGGELPDNYIVVFANTGCEREETLKFVHAIEQAWCDVTWLEYRYYKDRRGRRKGEWKNDVVVVDYETASRHGEPFRQLIEGHQYLPNINDGFCTVELKIETFSRFMDRHCGLKPGRRERKAKNGKPGRPATRNEWTSMIGFRRDEPARVLPRINEPDVLFPLWDAGIDTAAVQEFWSRQNFNLQLPSWMGNCRYCFKKGKKNLLHTIRLELDANDGELSDPDGILWWAAQEAFIAENKRIRLDVRNKYLAQFSKRHSIEELIAEARQPQIIPIEEIRDEPVVNCYCGETA